MDLHSLLNSQKESSLKLSDLRQLLSKRDSQATLDRIQNTTTYIYPNDKQETFQFFDTFIQLILSIVQEDDPYNIQYSKKIIIDSLRTCINGVLKDHGISWLMQFPHYFSPQTWQDLKTNNTILVYLYGLVLALMKKTESTSDWINGILQFMQSNSTAIITHLWLNCCCTLDEEHQEYAKDLFLQTLETRLTQNLPTDIVLEMFAILKDVNTNLLSSQVDQELGNALARPPFTKDQVMLGYIFLEYECQNRTHLSIVYLQFKDDINKHISKTRASFTNSLASSQSNPLLNPELTSTIPTDKYAQLEAIREGTLFWIKQMSNLSPLVFDMHLKDLIKKQYPTDKKTVLDLVLTDWALRDRFHRHLDLIADTFMTQLQNTNYNRRTSPYYAFVQLFNIPDEQSDRTNNQPYYQMKSGAYIDLSQFSNCSDPAIMNGCISLLQRMTLNGFGNQKVEGWMSDCLQSATVDIIKQITTWLCSGLESELMTAPSHFAQFLKLLLKSCIAKSIHIVPTVLNSFSERSLTWLLKQNTESATILLHYFDDGPQVSKDVVVTHFLTTKSKNCADLLLSYLKEHMSGVDPQQPRSRAWFKNHFLCNILTLVGEDQDGKSVASSIFRQLFTTREDFEWYFTTPLVPTQPVLFKSLVLANSHDIFAVKNTGLAAMFQELAMRNVNIKKERLTNVWFELWTSQDQTKFTMPASWILQCVGLYDQAPIPVKVMIKKFITIGISQPQLGTERKFLDRVLDLLLLSDTPEPDRLFELILNVISDCKGSFEDINSAIVDIMIELSEELDLEILALSSTPPQPPKQPKPIDKHKNKMTRLKLVALMKKHEEELEKYFKDLNSTTNKINHAIKALITLAQRIFNFLLRLLNNTSSLATVESTKEFLSIQQIQRLVNIPLYYVSLAKFAKVITQPEDLHKDIQTAIELSMDYLAKQPDKTLYEAAQKILKKL